MTERRDRQHSQEAPGLDDGKRLLTCMQEPLGRMGLAVVAVQWLDVAREFPDRAVGNRSRPFVEQAWIVLDECRVTELREVAWEDRSQDVDLGEHTGDAIIGENSDGRNLRIEQPSDRLSEG